MTDNPTGAIYVRPGTEARIVGPDKKATALAEALNDPRLQVAFLPGINVTAQVLTHRMMALVDVDHPVLVLPAKARARWDADAATRPRQILEYTGPLPDTGTVTPTTFDLVQPKADQ